MPSAFEKYAKVNVPRYTSYPTAPHFSTHFAASQYREWLGRLDPDEPVSLYLHVPFCKQQCWYCGCNMKLAARYSPVATYVQHLLCEIDLVAGALPARMPVSHLHFGGGTPTVLEPADLAAVMARLRERFELKPDAEIAIESDPRTLADEMIRQIGALGFNRASFGVQEFDPKVQAAINRIQPPEMVERAILGLRASGVPNINFDLIYGLPHQTAAALCRTVEQCVAMKPDRIALFGYAHVPWVAKNQRMIADDSLPTAPERAEQARAAAATLVKNGYIQIGIDHFALAQDSLAIAAAEGRLHRNFPGLYQRHRPHADRDRGDLDRPHPARLRPERQRDRRMVARGRGGKIADRSRPRPDRTGPASRRRDRANHVRRKGRPCRGRTHAGLCGRLVCRGDSRIAADAARRPSDL